MKIAIFETLEDHSAAIILDDNILYRPDIARKGNRKLSQAVFGNAIEAIIYKEPDRLSELEKVRRCVG